jgi:hypothetical protein
MMMYRVAIYIAIVSALVGAVGGVMEMNIANGDANWFPATNVHPIENKSIFTADQIAAMQPEQTFDEDKSLFSDVGSFIASMSSLLSIMWSMATGVFMVYPALDNVLRIDDGNGNNLFSPFLFLIQIGIWAIYAVGVAQIWRNANYKYNY